MKIKKHILELTHLIILILGIILLYTFGQYKHQSRVIQSISINFIGSESKLISKEEISNLLKDNVQTFFKKPISDIPLHKIETTLNHNPLINHSEAYLQHNSDLHIDIRQKVAIARLKTDKGIRYMDDQGNLMPVSSQFSKRVILVNGGNSKTELDEIYRLTQTIRADDFFNKNIIGISCQSNGDYVLNTRIGIHKIIFGKAESIDQKIKKLKIFYKRMWNEYKLKTYTTINIKYNKQVICT